MKITLPKFMLRKAMRIRVNPKPLEPATEGAQTIPENLQKKTTPALVESLSDNDPFIRSVAAEVLGRLKERAAVENLIALLKDHSKYVREKAAIALGHIGDRSAVPALIEALNDESEEVRVTVAGVLGRRIRGSKGNGGGRPRTPA